MKHPTHIFIVEIDFVARATFQECCASETEMSPTEYRASIDQRPTRIVPTENLTSLTLKRGVLNDQEILGWVKATKDGNLETKDITIALVNETGAQLCKWKVRNAWPLICTGTSFTPGNEVVIEELTLAHEGIEIA